MDMGPFDKCVEYLHENLEVLEELSLKLAEVRSGIPCSEIKEEPRHALPGDTSTPPADG